MESPYLASVYEYPSWILDFFAERKHKNECKEDWEQYFFRISNLSSKLYFTNDWLS